MSSIKPDETLLPYGRHWVTEEDIAAVSRTLREGPLTQGPWVDRFEAELAATCGSKYAVAVNSGTSALHIACLAADVGPGDEVITSPITFVASANCAFYCGAKPVFADVDPANICLDPKQTISSMTAATRAIIPVHFAGQSAKMDEFQQIAKKATEKFGRKIYVIEDACHALGGAYLNSKIGSCAYSDMTVLSFHPVKHITTGEGGAVLTNDYSLYRKLKMFRSHGITRDDDLMEDPSILPWGYEQRYLGYNYRVSDIQCALGISQLQKLPAFIKRRAEIASLYYEAFKGDSNIRTLGTGSNLSHAYHLFVVLLPFSETQTRKKVMSRLKELNIISQVHYIPVPWQPYFRERLGDQKGKFKNAEEYYAHCLSIPIFPAMKDHDVERVVQALRKSL